jgi:hypothetical protein
MSILLFDRLCHYVEHSKKCNTLNHSQNNGHNLSSQMITHGETSASYEGHVAFTLLVYGMQISL